MTWVVTCRNEIVTDHALIALGHREAAEFVREHGLRVTSSCVRAEFIAEPLAVAFANETASAFPEDEVAIWRLEQRAEDAPWPGRQRDIDHFSIRATDCDDGAPGS